MNRLINRQSGEEYQYAKNRLAYTRQIVEQSSSNSNSSLLFAFNELHDMVEKLLEDNKKLWEKIEEKELDLPLEYIDTSNFIMDNEEIRDILLKKIEIGQVFYPSDIADQYNLDLRSVMDVISVLKEKGQFIEKPD